MASVAKRPRSAIFNAEQVLELLEREEDSNNGMSSDEESVLDHLLLDSEENSSEEEISDGAVDDCVDEQVEEEEVEEELGEEDSSEEDGSGDEVPSIAAPVAPAALPARGGRPVGPAAGGSRRRVAAHRLRRPAARPSAPALSGGGTGARARARGRGRGAGRVRGADRGDGGGAGGARRNAAAPMAFQSYDDPDTPNPLPPFTPSRPEAISLTPSQIGVGRTQLLRRSTAKIAGYVANMTRNNFVFNFP